jgi:hypothetical protein
MPNARLSELLPITVGELVPTDLMLVGDVVAQESKKVTLQDLTSYILTDGNLTASIFGTASWANNAQTASYVVAVGTASYAVTASFALNGGGSGGSTVSASWASASLSSSYALSASYVAVSLATSASFASSSRFSVSSSYLIYSGGDNGVAATAIFAINAGTASFAINAGTTSASLVSTTASYSFSSSYSPVADFATNSTNAVFAQTASVGITTNIQDSASYASSSISSSYSDYAANSGNSVTASYVLPNTLLQQDGIFLANTQSNYRSQLDCVNLNPFVNNFITASVETMATIIVPFTASSPVSESITLYALGRNDGVLTTLDMTPISANFSTSGNGSFKQPIGLMGQSVLQSGSYVFFLSASSTNIIIDPIRTTRFNVSSTIGEFSLNAGETMQLTTNTGSDLLTYTSSAAGPFTTGAAALLTSGSSTITVMDISAVSGIRYIWTLNNLATLKSNGNILTSNIGGMPISIVSMSLQNGSLITLYPLTSTSASYLNVSGNALSALPNLASTMSFIDCSFNPIATFPTTFPFGLQTLNCVFTSVATPPLSLPASLVSMSFSQNSSLSSWLTALPTSLAYFDCSFCPVLSALPTIPSSMKYLNVSFSGFTAVAQDNICSNLVTNGLSNGVLNLLGNAPLLPTTLTRIATLQGNGWTVSY